MSKGLFITFEGIDGSGKTLVINEVSKLLEMHFPNKTIITTREPGGSSISEQIRNIILNKDNIDMDDEVEFMLYLMSRVQHVRSTIKPSLEKGFIVLCDRFSDSSLAYQGYGREWGYDRVDAMNKISVKIEPDKTIFLNIPLETSFERTKKRKNMDRLDNQSKEFHTRVHEGYREVMLRNSNRYHIINATKSKYEVVKTTYEYLKQYIEKKLKDNK